MPSPKRKRIENARQAKDRLAKGQGNYLKSDYAPYITIHDFSSQGLASRILHNGRIVQSMSNNETAFLRELQWAGAHEIFDQVALADFENLSVDETVKIASDLGISHPVHSKDGSPSVITTDFVAHWKTTDGQEEVHAFAVKPVKELIVDPEKSVTSKTGEYRTIDKLEIERRFWKARDIKWSLVTDHDLSQTRKSNIEHFLLTPKMALANFDRRAFLAFLAEYLAVARRTDKLEDLAHATGSPAHDLTAAQLIEAVRQLIADRSIEFDLDVKFEPSVLLSALNVVCVPRLQAA